jgi:hypothetical protein
MRKAMNQERHRTDFPMQHRLNPTEKSATGLDMILMRI